MRPASCLALLAFSTLFGCLEETVPLAAPSQAAPPAQADASPPASAPPAGTALPASPAPFFDPLAATDRIPQLDDAWELYGELSDGPVPSVEGGVLLCDLRVPSTGIFFRRPDLMARLTIRGEPAVRLVARNNREATVLTAPLARLATGDSIELSLEDRDLFSKNDHIDRATAEFAGAFPLLLVGEQRKLHGTCRLLRPDAVTERYGRARPQATAAVQAFGAALTPDATEPHFGHPGAQLRAAQEGILGLVALRGWADAPSVALKAELGRHRATWAQRAGDAVKQAGSEATARGSAAALPGGGSLTVLARHCGDAADAARRAMRPELEPFGGCVFELKITPGAGRLDAVLADGATGLLRAEAATQDGQGLDPLQAFEGVGERRVLAAPQGDGLSVSVDGARAAVLIRASHGGQAAFFSL